MTEEMKAKELGVSIEEYRLGLNVTTEEFWKRYGVRK